MAISNKKYILAFDQGTTSSRASLFDSEYNVIAYDSKKHEQIYQNLDWVSHNPTEILDNVILTGKNVLKNSKVKVTDISSVGITNQRETVVAWNRETGKPICNAIVWQCKRTDSYCENIKKEGYSSLIRKKTGLLVDSYFSATKMRWILDNVEEAKTLLESGGLCFGTIDSFLIYNFTKGKSHITDYTNASRTMLFNINTLEWDKELLKYLGIPIGTLPKVVASSGVCATIDKSFFGAALKIGGIAGDQHAALFGQHCFNKGDVKNTYGTGCFILQNIGSSPKLPRNVKKMNTKKDGGLLSTIAWNINGITTYAAEGSIFNAGSAIEWLIDKMKLISSVSELTEILKKTENSGEVYFVPAFSGLGAPKWDMNARATTFGMTLSTGRNQFVRAVCESIAYQVCDVIKYIEELTGVPINKLNVDGGICENDVIMQFQADVLNAEVHRPHNIETTILGVAQLAGLAVGMFDMEALSDDLNNEQKIFVPNMKSKIRKAHLKSWSKAVKRSENWL